HLCGASMGKPRLASPPSPSALSRGSISAYSTRDGEGLPWGKPDYDDREADAAAVQLSSS
ncbi:MAG: hypothetical protein J0H80_08430, partial [Rhizobiales bacterium]|nr:hypothetical protein [Hyphomicrobiales bacterium]